MAADGCALEVLRHAYDAWLAGGGAGEPPPCLDLRPRRSFADGPRLLGSCNVPLDGLRRHTFLLPDKTTPLVVVEPAAADYAIALERQPGGSSAGGGAAAAEQQRKGGGGVYLDGHTSPGEFLRASGWTVLLSLPASQELWAAATELGLVGSRDGGDDASVRLWLFAPAKLLSDEVEAIERQLLEGHTGDAAYLAHALDVGCGSGRDTAWLSSRKGSAAWQQLPGADGQQPAVRWHVTAVDSWFGALARSQELLQALSTDPSRVAPTAALHFAEVCPETGMFVPLPLPTRGRDAHALKGAGGLQFIVPGPPPQSGPTYDVVLCVRFFERSFLPHAARLVRTGGFILYCTFMDLPGTRRFGRPPLPRLVQPSELATTYFGPDHGFRVLRDDHYVIADGRELCMFVAQKVQP